MQMRGLAGLVQDPVRRVDAAFLKVNQHRVERDVAHLHEVNVNREEYFRAQRSRYPAFFKFHFDKVSRHVGQSRKVSLKVDVGQDADEVANVQPNDIVHPKDSRKVRVVSEHSFGHFGAFSANSSAVEPIVLFNQLRGFMGCLYYVLVFNFNRHRDIDMDFLKDFLKGGKCLLVFGQ
jgi:hypothetical protein